MPDYDLILKGGTVRKLRPRARLRDARPRRHDHRDGYGRHRWFVNRRHQTAGAGLNVAGNFALTTAQDESGRFVVDALSTDGGSYPRNVAIESTMALVRFAAMTSLQMAEKLAWMPARMMGLNEKGHFTSGAEADITILDPERGKPVMSFVAGSMIMCRGKSVGSGGTLIVTQEGEAAARNSGLPYRVVDLSGSKLYADYAG